MTIGLLHRLSVITQKEMPQPPRASLPLVDEQGKPVAGSDYPEPEIPVQHDLQVILGAQAAKNTRFYPPLHASNIDQEYQKLLTVFAKTGLNKNGERVFLDLDQNKELSERVEAFIKSFSSDQQQKGELWLHFNSVTDHQNSLFIAEDIQAFMKNQNFLDQDNFTQGQLRKQYLRGLKQRFKPLERHLGEVFDQVTKYEEESSKFIKVFMELDKRYEITKNKWLLTRMMGTKIGADVSVMIGALQTAKCESVIEGLPYLMSGLMAKLVLSGISSHDLKNLVTGVKNQVDCDGNDVILFKDNGSKQSGAELRAALRNGADGIEHMLGLAHRMPSMAVSPLAAMGVLLSTGPEMTTAVGLSIASMIFTAQLIGSLTRDKSDQAIHTRHTATRSIEQAEDARATLRTSPGTLVSRDKLKVKVEEMNESNRDLKSLSIWSRILTELQVYGGIGAGAYIGTQTGLAGPSLVASVQAFVQLGETAGMFAELASSQESVANVDRLHQLLEDFEQMLIDDEAKRSYKNLDSHKIEVSNVDYAYDDKQVLRDVNLELEPGDFVIFSGENGTGKSTLFDLLTLQMPPDAGHISIGGVDIQEINKHNPEKSIFNLMAIARQKPALLEGETLRENLCLGAKDISDEKMIEVLQQVGLYDESAGANSENPTLIDISLDQNVEGAFSGVNCKG